MRDGTELIQELRALESEALDAVREVGPGNHFFGCEHTLRNYETAFFDAAAADNTPFETWEENGSVDAATRANRAWKETLAAYEAPALDPGLAEQLADFVATRKASMEDRWY